MDDCPLVMIEWVDSAQPIPGWAWLGSSDYSRAVTVASVGWLIHDGDDVKALAPNMGCVGDDDMQVSGVIRIAARCIVKVTRLKEPKLSRRA